MKTGKKSESRRTTHKKSKVLNADQDNIDPMQADTVEIQNLSINSP